MSNSLCSVSSTSPHSRGHPQAFWQEWSDVVRCAPCLSPSSELASPLKFCSSAWGGILPDTHGTEGDAGKKISEKKRHLITDTTGLPMHTIVHPADVQERDEGIYALSTMFGLYPALTVVFADGGYQGRVAAATHTPPANSGTKSSTRSGTMVAVSPRFTRQPAEKFPARAGNAPEYLGLGLAGPARSNSAPRAGLPDRGSPSLRPSRPARRRNAGLTRLYRAGRFRAPNNAAPDRCSRRAPATHLGCNITRPSGHRATHAVSVTSPRQAS